MLAAQWQQLQSLFHLIADLPEDQREPALLDRCADPDLRAEVLALLRADQRMECIAAPVLAPEQPPAASIGPYLLLRCIGSGGMGTVYLVERDVAGTRQRAALKMLAPHAAGPSFIERFHREQHILASLEHPNITRLLDAGVTDVGLRDSGFREAGQPYLVMEFVEGRHLDAYCDDHKLTVEERLQLFLHVCHAVDHAHRNLIVHLDLKPSNILVTENGIPKLLDFGTSKLLHLDGRFTSTQLATPSYASPEQLRHESVTTACDIYSLGVILFELLAGRRPGADSSIAALIQNFAEEREPARLDGKTTAHVAANRRTTVGALRASLAGDLSTIVRKSLRIRPQDRYPSVSSLAEDIRRYLAHRPILARRQTALYLVEKFVRRNRGKVLASALLALALIAVLAYAFSQQRKALFEQQRALAESARSARTQAFMSQLFRLANSNFSGTQATSLSDFLGLGIKMAPLLANDKQQTAEVECSLAISLLDSGNPKASTPVFEKALADARSAHDSNTETEALSYLTGLYFDDGQIQKALATGRAAARLAQTPGVSGKSRADAYQKLAYVLVLLRPADQEGVHLLEQAARIATESRLPAWDRATVLGNLAWADSIRGHLPEAETNARESIALYRALPVQVCDIAEPVLALARVYRVQRRFSESETLLRDNYQRVARCMGSGYDMSLAVLGQWGYSLVLTGHPQEAAAKLEEGLAIAQKTYAGRNSEYLIDILGPLGLAYEATGQPEQAEKAARASLAILPPNPENPSMGLTKRTLGRALYSQGKFAEALPYLEAADQSYAKHAPDSLYAQGLHAILEQDRAELARISKTNQRVTYEKAKFLPFP